ncbi:L-threonylcarbamoyladenylate synthase [Holdemanella sp.]|uniref:L-threonylcarbamoyladenylate synthase n=1 Tax=Holdemanella sp. TaxID=1971762 RepID=UPI0030798E47
MKEYTKNQVHEVACAFNEHKIIALPTDTVYGVGVKYGNLDDLERLKRAKHRPETKPIPMMVSNVEQMKQVALVDERIEKIAAKFLPGALTLVVNVKDSVDSAYTNGLSTIAIRIPDEKFILDVIDELNCPILVTSANQSGEKTALQVMMCMNSFQKLMVLYLERVKRYRQVRLLTVQKKSYKS